MLAPYLAALPSSLWFYVGTISGLVSAPVVMLTLGAFLANRSLGQ
jgi:hypothetical protein